MYADVSAGAAQGSDTRVALGQYTVPLLDRFALMSSVCAMMFDGLIVVTTRRVLAFSIPSYCSASSAIGFSSTAMIAVSRRQMHCGAIQLTITVVTWGILCAYLLRQP